MLRFRRIAAGVIPSLAGRFLFVHNKESSMNSAEDRIARLRRRCLERKEHAWRDITVGRARGLQKSAHLSSWQERQGMITREVLALTEFALDEYELLAGQLSPRPEWITDDVLADAQAVAREYPVPGGQRGHCELDLEFLLHTGLDTLYTDIAQRRDRSTGARASTCQSFLYALEGLRLCTATDVAGTVCSTA